MPLIIDTFNVLHVVGVLPPELAGVDVAGLAGLLASSRYRWEKVTYVCDGAAPPGLPGIDVGGGRVRFSGAAATADEVIAALIRRSTSPRQLTVVSSDRAVQREARRRRCRTVTSEEFLRQLTADRERSEGRPKRREAAGPPASGIDVEAWMRVFDLSGGEGDAVVFEEDVAEVPEVESREEGAEVGLPEEGPRAPVIPGVVLPDEVLREAEGIWREGEGDQDQDQDRDQDRDGDGEGDGDLDRDQDGGWGRGPGGLVLGLVVGVTGLLVGGCEPGGGAEDRASEGGTASREVAVETRPSPWDVIDGSEQVVLEEEALDAGFDRAVELARASAGEARERWRTAGLEDREGWAIKWAAPTEDGAVEYVWVEPEHWSPFRIEGRLASPPRRELACGRGLDERVAFPVEEMADWVHYLTAGLGRGDRRNPGDGSEGPREGGFTIDWLEERLADPG